MKTSEALRKAFELLGENGERWIQGDWARDEKGEIPRDLRDPNYRKPVQWCSWGAIAHLRKDDGDGDERDD